MFCIEFMFVLVYKMTSISAPWAQHGLLRGTLGALWGAQGGPMSHFEQF